MCFTLRSHYPHFLYLALIGSSIFSNVNSVFQDQISPSGLHKIRAVILVLRMSLKDFPQLKLILTPKIGKDFLNLVFRTYVVDSVNQLSVSLIRSAEVSHCAKQRQPLKFSD